MKHAGMVAIAGLALVGGAIGFAGCGASEGSGATPFTASDSQARAGCLMGVYLPERTAGRVAAKPPPRSWSTVETAAGAFQPDRAVVEVTLRPKELGEEIVLTGIRFDVVRHALRPLGTVFHRPCRRELVGPAIEVDLDGDPTLGKSSAALDGRIGPGLQVPPSRPIRFPWTIPLERPLRLYLVAHAEHSYVSWGARVRWESGSSEGVIRVDNGGRKYKLADSIGLSWLKPGAGERWVSGQPPRYTNAE